MSCIYVEMDSFHISSTISLVGTTSLRSLQTEHYDSQNNSCMYENFTFSHVNVSTCSHVNLDKQNTNAKLFHAKCFKPVLVSEPIHSSLCITRSYISLRVR